MKFKTQTDLKTNIYSKQFPSDTESYDLGINNAFISFKERITFYKKYEGRPIGFYRDIPFKDLTITREDFRTDYCAHYYDSTQINTYNIWLFNYCFGDIK